MGREYEHRIKDIFLDHTVPIDIKVSVSTIALTTLESNELIENNYPDFCANWFYQEYHLHVQKYEVRVLFSFNDIVFRMKTYHSPLTQLGATPRFEHHCGGCTRDGGHTGDICETAKFERMYLLGKVIRDEYDLLAVARIEDILRVTSFVPELMSKIREHMYPADATTTVPL